MSYSVDDLNEDYYDGTSCLVNKLNIRNEQQLKDFESAITFAKASKFIQESICLTFDENHYKAIHKFLFEDIYDWAGQYRTVEMSKKGTTFARSDSIPNLMNNCFKRLQKRDYFRNLEFNEFVENIVDFYCVTNIIHPFREGNGRTQRVFLTQLINHNDYIIDFSEVDTDELMIATIHAANGVRDYLSDIFKKVIK